jgi:hypothetical protein
MSEQIPKVAEAIAGLDALKAALDKAATVTGASSYAHCHERLEEHRKTKDAAQAADNPDAKKLLTDASMKTNRVLWDQQIAAHVLYDRIAAGDMEALAHAGAMAAALNEVMS